eukprot:8152892-Alexandrium_andersonii.AAC.1
MPPSASARERPQAAQHCPKCAQTCPRLHDHMGSRERVPEVFSAHRCRLQPAPESAYKLLTYCPK